MAYKFVPYAPEGSGGKDPILGELVVTENGVYDEPVIAGGLEPITWDGVIGDRPTNSQLLGVPHVKVSDVILSASDFIGASITRNDGRVEAIPENSIGTIGSAVIAGEGAILSIADVNVDFAGTTIVFPETGTYVFYADDAPWIQTITFPASEPTPADGWNKVTVNVAGDIIDVPELPTENVDDGKIYRTQKEDAPIIWFAGDPFGTGTSLSMPLAELMGSQPKVIVAETLPDTMEPTDNTTVKLSVYVIKSTGIAYVSEDGTSISAITLGAYMGGMSDGGWVNSAEDIVSPTVPTFYAIPGEKITAYGVPNTNSDKQIYLYSDQTWINEIEKLTDEKEELQEASEGYINFCDNVVVGDDGYGRTAITDITSTDMLKALYIPSWIDAIAFPIGLDNKVEKLNYDDLNRKYLGNKDNPYLVLVEAPIDTAGSETNVNFHEETKILGAFAFENYEASDNIVIPSTITDIGVYCFSYARMTNIDLSSASIKCLREGIFSECNNLVSVILPEKLTTIEKNAFYSCGSLALIALPEDLTEIRETAFRYCTNLANLSLPKGITKISWGTFDGCSNLASITLPDGLTHIDDWGFTNCSSLALTSLPESLIHIGSVAFRDCSNLALTELPKGVISIGSTAFMRCAKLALTSLPEGLITIECDTFSNCTSLALTSLPEGVTSIGESAFDTCTSLALTSLPEGVTSIGERAFYYCTSLTLTSLPASIDSIGYAAFGLCTGLTSITFEGTPTTIDSSAFGSCTNLTDIYVPWAEGAVANAPWGATNATIHYNHTA